MQTTSDPMHDLRERATLAKGWLDTLLRYWERLDDRRKREMVAAALFGANQMAVALERLDGREPPEIRLPDDQLPEEFLGLIEDPS
ncbi:MAG: hypothetical protein ACRDI3_00855 [Actinomycetota bacterium]